MGRERGGDKGGKEREVWISTFFMFSARRSYSSSTSCSRGESSGGEARRALDGRGPESILAVCGRVCMGEGGG